MPLPEEKRYTYADLLSWDDDTRFIKRCGQNIEIILANEKICRIHPPCPPSVWRAGQGAATMIAIPIPAAAEKGSPEG